MAVSHTPSSVAKQPPASPAIQITGKPVARVNGTVLTDRDLVREMYTLFPYAAQHNGQVPPEMAPQIRQGALKMIVFEELLYQEALRRQMTIPPAKLQKAEADFRGQFTTPAEYKQFLNQEFQGSEKALHEKIRRSLLIDAVLKAEVDNKSTVSLAEARLTMTRIRLVSSIPKPLPSRPFPSCPRRRPRPANLKELRKRADDALKQAKATKNYEQFGMLAEKISEDDYRVMMGDHKRVDRSKLAPQVVQALLAMKAGRDHRYHPAGTGLYHRPPESAHPARKAEIRRRERLAAEELQKRKLEQTQSRPGQAPAQANAKVEEL